MLISRPFELILRPALRLALRPATPLRTPSARYNAQKVKPLYPFGHGLSYSTFEFTDLKVELVPTAPGSAHSHIGTTAQTSCYEVAGSTIRATFQLRNSGLVTAAVVPQLYLAFPQISGSGEQAIEQEPPRQLKAFQKLTLDPVGASTTVTMEISAQARAIWDVDTHAWKPITGTFLLEVGSSSADIRVNQLVQVGK